MSAVVDGITCDDESDRWHVETGGVIGVGMADIDRNDLVAFKLESGLIEPLRNSQAFRYQTREAAAPVLDRVWSKCGLHDIHHLGHGKCMSLGEAITQQFQAKEMVRVPMRNIDGRHNDLRRRGSWRAAWFDSCLVRRFQCSTSMASAMP
jgi:hypothetical protein